MFEGIILIIFAIAGGLTALLALFFFVIAIIRQSKTMAKIALAIAIVPISLCTVVYWFYDIHIPSLSRQQEKAYTGTYVMIPPGDNVTVTYKQLPKLILNADNSFQLDKNDFSSFYGSGTWKAGATDDGQFEFRNKSNSIVFWATPSNENKLEINKDFSDRRQIVFVK